MKTFSPRKWQLEFHRSLAKTKRDNYLLVACPAAGKTLAGGTGAANLMRDRNCAQLIVVAPTVVVRDQWAATLESLGFRMANELPSHGVLPKWHHGVATTYAQAAYRADQLNGFCEDRRTVVICDEIHHASEQRTWGEGLQRAFESAAFRLLLSGTPFRSDGKPLPFVSYDHHGDCEADFAYDYARAVAEGICRPIEFKAHDGQITWSTGPVEVREATFTDELPNHEIGHRLRAALDPGQPYLRNVLERANHDLQEMRERVPDAAGLVICDSQQHALHVDRILNKIAGSVPTIAISDIPRSHQALAAFATDTEPWLVSVRMVSEGVDIPRLGVVVWLTGASTELMVRQVAGRALRGRNQHLGLPAIVHMPADPRLVRHAKHLEILAGVSVKTNHGSRSGHNKGKQPDRGKVTPLSATPDETDPVTFTPRLPAASSDMPLDEHDLDPIDITLPELPPSPTEIKEAARIRDDNRARIFRLLQIYTELRRDDDPSYQLATAHHDLAVATGQLPRGEENDERLTDALTWINEQTARLALTKPDLIKAMARRRRRAQLAMEAA